jgi:hypothetical protein
LPSARKSGLRFLQQDVLDQRNAVLGNQRSFAGDVNDYIEEKLAVARVLDGFAGQDAVRH